MSKTCPVCGTAMIGKECAFCGYSEEKKTKVKEVESNKPEYEHDFANSVHNTKIKVRKDSSSQSTFVTAICIVALLIIGICLVVVLAFWGLIIFSNADLRKMEREEKLQKLKLKNQVLKAQSGESISNITKDNKTTKNASVAKRAAAGAIIAGETGAIIGAASAINENLKNKDN